LLCIADWTKTTRRRILAASAGHRTGSLVAAGVLVLLIVVNSFLLLRLSRRKHAEEALRKHQQQLEDLVRERSAQLEHLNSQLRLDILEYDFRDLQGMIFGIRTPTADKSIARRGGWTCRLRQ